MLVTFLTPADLFDFWTWVLILALVVVIPCAFLLALGYLIKKRREAASEGRDAGRDKHE